MNQDTLKEKQLKDRGTALMHGIFLMSLMLMADTYLRTRSYILIDGIWDNTFIIIVAFTVICLEMILKNAFDLRDPVWTALAAAMGIGCLGVFLSQAYLIFFSRDSFFLITESISSNGFFLISSALGILVAISYFMKRNILKK
ncbi:hypothetical protein [Anaerostipes sp.]|uniref:hypothetical protein n=1 Tax=Anaerostipes sp. TaxID=1872530 RepID=UPI0025BCCF9D|nr:hypothetical protein [Anaerostipes sp.]MBS7007321.1 hypothetical protein [Anaerostipes sp.]